jgi:micrococcal nuclease
MASLTALEEPDGETLRVQVLKVFDGDGFLSQLPVPHTGRVIQIAVRCGFIDAPELEQPGGNEARDFLTELIATRWLDLSLLMKADTGRMTDRFRRVVAVPYLKQGSSYQNIELEMVLNGWAWLLDRYCPPEHYYLALEDAQRHRRGIWAMSGNIHPWEFKKQTYRRRREQIRGTPDQSTLFPKAQGTRRCPQAGCEGQLVQRAGKFGTFFGCSEFPRCRYSCSSPE